MKFLFTNQKKKPEDMSLPFVYFSFSLFILPSLRTSHTCVKTEKLAIQTVVKLGNLRDFHNLDRKFIIFFFKHESHTRGYIYIYRVKKNLCLILILQVSSCFRSSTVTVVPLVTGEGSSDNT